MIWDLVRDALTRMRAPTPGAIVDRRAHASRDKIGGLRPWSKVTGITLHQTACVLGERPARWDTVGAHIGITRQGRVIWLHDFNRIVWHGNGFNAQTVGIEIDGLYAGIEGDPRTVWNGGKADKLSIEATEAACQAIRWICSDVADKGGKVGALVAHRQSSATRRADPGEAIWHSIAMPMHVELGLSDGGDGFKIGDGRPIPNEWDSARTGRY